ncbi:hypothetical protein MTO96_044069 [Rhipicephalus appendiculatus]
MIPQVVPAISLLWLVGVCGAVGPTQLKPYNAECSILFPVSETKNCRPVKYYYNSKTGLCGPTCSQDAPFSTRKECALTCRSTLACFIRRQHQRCRGGPRVVVFRFDVYKGKCYAKKSCSYKGNNFPTLKECMSTCSAGAGSTKLSGGDEEGGSSSEQQVREQAPLPQLPGQTTGNLAVLIRPELPNIGKPPSILQLPKEKPLLPSVPPTFPDQKPDPPIENGIQSEVRQRDPRCIVRISNTTRTCNAFKLYYDQNTHLCKATCSNLAPFESRSECNSICRSAVVCFHQFEEEDCESRHKATVFLFDPKKGICLTKTGCSNRGNNFPTLQECILTCATYTGSQGTIQVSAAQLNISSGKEPPKEPPKQQATEKPSNTGVVLKVPESAPPVPSEIGTTLAVPQQGTL